MAIHKRTGKEPEDLAAPRFTRTGMLHVPKNRVPDRPMFPQTAYQVVMDEVMLDGNARFNLATFVTTWMDEEADRLYAATFDKNMVDKDEYPQTAEIESRCVRMLADLWHAPYANDSVGTSTTGSSEGCMLAGLALKRRWQHARRAAGKSTDRPNIVMGGNVQVVWEKFANYWDVEPRYVPLEGNVFHLTADRLLEHVDENTIGVVAVLGSTMDGSYEPVQEICDKLDEYEAGSGVSVPVHVDAASGGFIAPFVQPDLQWDFRLPRVVSIQASGHKFGLVYPGVGWVLWRDAEHLPEDLIFHVNYLGGDMPTFALNFSRPGAQVILQYFQFLRLGKEGFSLVQQTCQDVAVHIARALDEMPEFHVITSGTDLPVVCFTLERRRHQVRRVRRLSEAARARLAGAGVHDAAEARGSVGAAGRGAQRLQSRHGRDVPRRPPHRDAVARQPRHPHAPRGTAQRLPPLSEPVAGAQDGAVLLETLTQQKPGCGASSAETAGTPSPSMTPSMRARFMPQTSSVCLLASRSNGQLARQISAAEVRGSYPCRASTSAVRSRPLRSRPVASSSNSVAMRRPSASAASRTASATGTPSRIERSIAAASTSPATS